MSEFAVPQVKLASFETAVSGTYYCYLLGSTPSGLTYVGMTNDLARRLRQHNGELAGGASYTEKRRPWRVLMVLGPYDSMREAMRVEWRWKRFRGAERLRYRRWVAELDDEASDKDAHLHHYKRRRRRRRKAPR